jgi:hypothetical protein
MRTFTFLTLVLASLVSKSSAFITPEDVIVQCNEYFQLTENFANGCFAIRYRSLLNIAIHNVVNSVDPVYRTFQNVVYTPPNSMSLAAAILGACNVTKSTTITGDRLPNSNIPFFSPSKQAVMQADLASFVQNITVQLKGSEGSIQRGFDFGTMVAQDFINSRENDGYKTVVPPIMGVPPFLPDGSVNPDYDLNKWYSSSTLDGYTYPPPPGNVANGGAICPQYAYSQTMGLPSSSYIYTPPRPSLNSTEMFLNVQLTYTLGNSTNPYQLRTPTEQADAMSIGAGSAHTLTNRMVEKVVQQLNPETKHEYNLLTVNDVAYLYAQNSLNSFDSFVHNIYWKTVYNYSRPAHVIHWGGQFNPLIPYPQYQADPYWHVFMVGGPNQEYPCGHCEVSAAGTESLRLTLVQVGVLAPGDNNIPGGPISTYIGPTAPFSIVYIPNQTANITVGKFNEFKDRVIRARVTGGMHFTVSGNIGKSVGDQIAAYNIATHMTKL